jgi:hypothetical protein
MSRVLYISFTDLGRDPRFDWQVGFLRTRHEVIAAGLGPPGYEDVRFIDLTRPAPPRMRELARRAVGLAGLVGHRYESVYWRNPGIRLAAARLANRGADVVVAKDLAVLPLACEVANGAPVVFDAPELSTAEQADMRWWRMIMAPYTDAMLRRYLPRVAAMMTVAPGIAEIYERTYGVGAVVATNASPRIELEPTPVHEPIRLIHHGVADPQRCLELMIEASDSLDERFRLDLMLVPRKARYYAHLQRMVAARPRVNLLEPVGQREIVRYCNDYDVGVYLLAPRNENLRHALPNKLFEFIQARLAIVIGPSPEMASVVKTWDCGVVAEDFSPSALASALSGLTPERISAFKQRSHQAAGEVNSERNGEIVLGLIERVLGGSRPKPSPVSIADSLRPAPG